MDANRLTVRHIDALNWLVMTYENYRLGCAAVIPFQTVPLPFKVILHFVLFILIPMFLANLIHSQLSTLETVCTIPFQTVRCRLTLSGIHMNSYIKRPPYQPFETVLFQTFVDSHRNMMQLLVLSFRVNK